MAPNGRVNPNCVYVSNPYHECTEDCLQKIKQTRPQRNKNSSGFGRSVTDGELGKNMNEGGRRYSGCPKASNPYHECDEDCFKKLLVADSGAALLNLRRKQLGSKTEPPVLDSVPASKIGAIYLSGASSPISLDSKKAVSGKIPISDVTPVHHKNASNKVVPILCADETGEGHTSAAGEFIDFSSSSIPQGNEGSDDREGTESVVSESRVAVGSYHVKESFEPILQSILEKYRDIGESCHLESVVMRSYYVECVCFVVQDLQSDSIIHLTKSKVTELSAILKDVESAQLRVPWLRSILDEIAQHIELINQPRDVEVDHQMESLRKELQSELQTLAQKEQEVADIQRRITEIRDHLGELELKASELDDSMISIESQVDNLLTKSRVDELL